MRLGSYGAERGEGRSGRGHRCVPGLLQEGPGGVHKGDGIRQQTEGREKQQGAGDGAREDVAEPKPHPRGMEALLSQGSLITPSPSMGGGGGGKALGTEVCFRSSQPSGSAAL